jgi:hypothetical protein
VNQEPKTAAVIEDKKAVKDTTASKSIDKFKDWLGVGDLDVSSSSEEEDESSSNTPVKSKLIEVCEKIFFFF